LGLNNSGDTITLRDFDGEIINAVTYGSEGNNDQSLTRFPEGTYSEFALHSSIPEAQGRLYSPGTAINGEMNANIAVAEPLTLLSLCLGLGVLCFKEKKKNF